MNLFLYLWKKILPPNSDCENLKVVDFYNIGLNEQVPDYFFLEVVNGLF